MRVCHQIGHSDLEELPLTIVKYSLIKSREFFDETLVADVDNEKVLGQCLCARTSVTDGKFALITNLNLLNHCYLDSCSCSASGEIDELDTDLIAPKSPAIEKEFSE